ncbi:GNAT family N-acetyltransferase [Teredinibacter haidensis]|uniref:bifunctional acetate--CoA ligase family protein/GNAT family N-acetyltransferase n=1 Tax=Teredinibacter haidensis TaxID=2731755 RepID=UPI000948B9F7|nr:GNAT family N-acetyltransferase [Teredinibacter haidensis]
MSGATEHYLSPLFEPESVAVFGASQRSNSVATIVLNNIVEAGFKGSLYAINPKHKRVGYLPCYASLAHVDAPVELAIIATPAATVPAIFRQCGEHGVKAAVVLSGGFGEAGEAGQRLERELLDIAKHYGIRFIGPNCLGVIHPPNGFNATFAGGNVNSGNIALISQSGALCTAILDWAESKDIGFSTVVSTGISADIDFGEILDFLVADAKTRSILMYVEGIRDARSFMSGLRAAARVKPVIVVKAGRHKSGIKAALSHNSVNVVADDVFDAALSRAGVVRGMHIGDLFSAATVLTEGIRLKGVNLAIITNGGGPAAMACDKASDLNIPLAKLQQDTLEQLDRSLPPMWSRANPVDVLGNADAQLYQKALSVVLADDNVHGVMVLLTPQATTDPVAVAEKLVECSRTSKKPIIACWMGARRVREGRNLLTNAGIPNYRLPELAIQGFAYLTSFYRNQKLLLQTPGPLSQDHKPDIAKARSIIKSALDNHCYILNEIESKAILSAFHIPVAPTMVVDSSDQAVAEADKLGYPVAMKTLYSDVSDNAGIGGVHLNLSNENVVRTTFEALSQWLDGIEPTPQNKGIVVEPMVSSYTGRKLRMGITADDGFGPIISFGSGGASAKVVSDSAVSLPPLNRLLAKDMISRTRVSKLLAAFRDTPDVDSVDIENCLLRISEIACELPEIVELDINPIIADANTVMAVGAHIVIRPYDSDISYSHTAIHPYPSHLDIFVTIAGDVKCNIRPIRPEDAKIELDFVEGLSDSSKHFRFMNTFRKFPPEMLAKLTQIDYDREMAFIAVITQDGQEEEIGVARYAISVDRESCEFAITVADVWQGKGVAHELMSALIQYAAQRGLKRMTGEILADNTRMQQLARRFGFSVHRSKEDSSIMNVAKELP